MSENIQKKVILITGGSTGLGAETARHLASKGARVAIAARRKDKLDDVVAQIIAAGGEARAYQLDVIDKGRVQAVVDAIIADFGKLDVLINNAGIMPIRPMAEVNTDEWDAMIDVNIKGTLYGIAAALPIFLRQESGHIINLSSVAGIRFLRRAERFIPARSLPFVQSRTGCAKRSEPRCGSRRSTPAPSTAN